MAEFQEINNIGIRVSEDQYQKLKSHLFQNENEQLAYIFATRAVVDDEIVFIVKRVIIPACSDIIDNSVEHVTHKFEYYHILRLEAIDNQYSFFTVHSHRKISPIHSKLDDICDQNILRLLTVTNNNHHGSIIINDNGDFSARFLENDTIHFVSINYIYIYGKKLEKRFSFALSRTIGQKQKNIFDRQLRFLSEDRQYMFSNFRVAIIGVGGTGSSIAHQLRRLGLGHIYLIDDDVVTESNISRLCGSISGNEGLNKTDLIASRLELIYNFGVIKSLPCNAFSLRALETLKMVDFIFVASDEKDLGRYITQLVVKYYGVPAIDVGIELILDNKEGVLSDMCFRSHYLLPNEVCLFKVNTLNMNEIYGDLLYISDPKTHVRQIKEGYIKDKTQIVDPAVVSFNNYAASRVVSIFVRLIASKYKYSQEKRRLFDITYFPQCLDLVDCDCDFCNSVDSLRGDRDYPLDIYSWKSK